MSKDSQKPRFVLSPTRMQHVSDLVSHLAQAGIGFKVFPPQVVLDDPAVLSRDSAADELAETTWSVRQPNGSEDKLTFPELMSLFYHLLAIKMGYQQAKQRGRQSEINVSVPFDMATIMSPAAVKSLLAKLQVEGLDSRKA